MTRLATSLCLSLLLCACSLLGLDEYDQIACDPDQTNGTPECDALNARLPAGSCGRFYCHPTGKGCFYEARVNPETCDGLDNNCNGYIDEGAEFSSEERRLDEPGVARVSSAATTDGTLHLLLTRLRGNFDVSRRTVSGSEIGPSEPALLPESRCTAPPEQGSRPCNLSQLAVAAARHVVVAAGIHISDCNDGQLRLGAASPSEPLPMGDDPEARVSFGIDVDREGERACSHSSDCDGASDPALALWAAEGTGASEGLLLWRAPTNAHACDLPRVAGLGFSVDSGGGEFSRLRLQESTTRVSDAVALGPPVVTAVGSVGYAAGFSSDDDVVLLLVPSVTTRESVEVLDEMHLSASQPRNVALVRGNDQRMGVGVAYRSQTDDGPALVFQSLAVTESRFERLEAARTLPIDGEIVDGPALAYAPDGFYSAFSGDPQGGYWLLWVERRRGARDGDHNLVAARIAERGSKVLNDRIPLVVGSIHQVFTYSQYQAVDAAPVYGYLTDREIRVGSALCDN